MSKQWIILGAGPTGLGAALQLKRLAHDAFCVYDAAGHVGGLCASFRDEKGFTWDIGGHVQFSHYAYFDDLMREALGDRWLRHQRESWIWIDGRFVPYPFQNNLRYLSPEKRWDCICGLIELYKRRNGKKPKDFAEWIEATFGRGLANLFMRPYNLKVWAHPLETLDYRWVGERIAVTDLQRVLDNVLHEKDDLAWGPNNTFQFPLHGGTGAAWEAVADLVGREHITLGAKATQIDPYAQRVHFADGRVADYDVLISTIPLDRLVAMTGLVHLAPAAAKLSFSSSHVVGVGLAGKTPQPLATKSWLYFPEPNCPFYRVTVFSNYSPNNVPGAGEYWSLMAEVSESCHKQINAARIIEETIRGLRETHLVAESHEIVSTWHHRVHYGYPTPTLGRDDAIGTIQGELERLGIFSRGRFGGWKYEVANQDHSLMQGVELVNRLVLGVPEVTYWFPNTANDLAYAKARPAMV